MNDSPQPDDARPAGVPTPVASRWPRRPLAPRWLRDRAAWAGLFAFVGLVSVVRGEAPPPQTPEGVASMLGAAAGGEVRVDDYVWERRGGFLHDAFLGRQVLFLARAGGAGADLFRARVRLSRGGHPIAVTSVRRLTESRFGDENSLVARDHYAAYATTAFGAVQGVTLLDLDGPPPRGAGTRGERLARAIDAWVTGGDPRGIGVTEVSFGNPPREVKQEIQGDLLVLALGKDALPAALGMGDGVLSTGSDNAYEAVVARIPPPHPTLGSALARAASILAGDAVGRSLGSLLAPAPRVVHATPPLSSSRVAGEPGWPPPAIAPLVRPAAEGEGAWAVLPLAGEAPAGAPPAAFQTAVRPDSEHPASWVWLAAVDTRQLDLKLVAGAERPRSEIGLHGTGTLADRALGSRAVLAFAGAADADREAFRGCVVEHRVLIAPSAGAPTIALASDGRVMIGALGALPPPASVVSLRQTREPLLGGAGSVASAEASGPEERSALGRTREGQLVYAWSSDATSRAMTKALELAGAVYAVPLASAPAKAGLRDSSGEPLVKEMSLGARALSEPSPEELFIAVRRTFAPPPLVGTTWTPDGGRQPAPTWIPAILGATVTSLGAQVHLTSFAPGRVSFRIRAGAREPATKAVTTLPTAVPEEERARVIAAVSLSAGKKKGARGLGIDGVMALPMRLDDGGALAVEGGRIRVVRSTEIGHGFAGDASELPLTADEGKLRPEARDVGTMRLRASACVLDDGTFVVASTTFDSDEAATTALLDLGCARVVALDRGLHQSAALDRAGVGSGTEPRYEATTLFVLEQPLSGRASDLLR